MEIKNKEEYKFILVGITGGIGAGKTTVSNYLENKGYPIINADNIAKNILQNNNDIQKKIIEEFGEQSYIDGKYNASFISQCVFGTQDDNQSLHKLNKIVHPQVLEDIINEVEQLASVGQKIIFVDIALLFELNLEEGFDYIITVYADDEQRLQRVAERSKLSYEEIKARFVTQIAQEEKMRYSDFTIENNKTLEELYKSTDFILNILLLTI